MLLPFVKVFQLSWFRSTASTPNKNAKDISRMPTNLSKDEVG